MNWRRVTDTMIETDDRVFQISRAPPLAGRITYRAWRRSGNLILLAVDADDNPESRAVAVEKCKAVCEAARM